MTKTITFSFDDFIQVIGTEAIKRAGETGTGVIDVSLIIHADLDAYVTVMENVGVTVILKRDSK